MALNAKILKKSQILESPSQINIDSRSRSWEFTIINYDYDDLSAMVCGDQKWKYICFALDTNEQGLLRMRGYINFVNQVKLRTLNELMEYSFKHCRDITINITNKKARYYIKLYSKKCEFYEFGIRQGTTGESKKIIPTSEIINERIKNKMRQFMLFGYPKVANQYELDTLQLIKYSFIQKLDQKINNMHMNKQLKGLQDYANFHWYVYHMNNILCQRIPFQFEKKLVKGKKITQEFFNFKMSNENEFKSTLDMIKYSDYNISLDTKEFILNYCDLFNDDYEYAKETDIDKLKLYLLLLLIPITSKWYYDWNNNKLESINLINGFNNLLKPYDIQYNYTESFSSFCNKLLYHSSTNISNILDIIEYCININSDDKNEESSDDKIKKNLNRVMDQKRTSLNKQ
jgi:hypothetical protein